jgi:PPOX class probable F420-dependent enzyme
VNRRQEIQLTDTERNALLREVPKAALATIDKDGYPHIVAMNYVAKDGLIYMTSYRKAQKVVNIRRNPKVSVMVETGRKYSELRGLMIRGTCEIIDSAEAVMETFRDIAHMRGATGEVQRPGAWASKRVVLKIMPVKIASWDHRKLGGRY